MDVIDMRDWRTKPSYVTYALTHAKSNSTIGTTGQIGIRYHGKVIGWIVPGDENGPNLAQDEAPDMARIRAIVNAYMALVERAHTNQDSHLINAIASANKETA